MPRLGGGGGGVNSPPGAGPTAPYSLVPGGPLDKPDVQQPFRVRAIAGKLCNGGGVVRMVQHTANDGNPADGNPLAAVAVILQELESGEVIFYEQMNPGQILYGLFIPFRSGLVAYANAPGVIVSGQLGVNPNL